MSHLRGRREEAWSQIYQGIDVLEPVAHAVHTMLRLGDPAHQAIASTLLEVMRNLRQARHDYCRTLDDAAQDPSREKSVPRPPKSYRMNVIVHKLARRRPRKSVSQ